MILNWSAVSKANWKLSLAALSLLGACHSDPAQGQYVGDSITRTDFDDLLGWGADPAALTREHAHSGRFATFVGPGRDYSLTYRLPLGQASVHTVRAVEIDAWVYLPSSSAAASLNVQLGRAGAGSDAPPLYAEQLNLLDQVHEFGKWVPVHRTFVLPEGAPGESELRIFLWRQSSPEPVYLDDLHVKARE